MRATHSIKINGKWFKAGEELPVLNEHHTERKEKTLDGKKSYRKSDISKMPAAELQELAESEGIENATELTGSELKKSIIEKYGL